MMPKPVLRFDRQDCDDLRFCTPPADPICAAKGFDQLDPVDALSKELTDDIVVRVVFERRLIRRDVSVHSIDIHWLRHMGNPTLLTS
jgi:hypothetical protein